MRCTKALLIQFAIAASFCIAPARAVVPEPPPHARISRTEFPDADAVILRHEQVWMLSEDGSIRLAEHKWVKMLSPRAIPRVADPPIDFREGAEELNILIARTFTPDGRAIDVPDYGRNLISPGGAADWPAFADLRQWVVSFSGVQPDAIYELATERVIKPGRQRWLAADLRLQEHFPTIERQVTVTVPAGVRLAHRIDNQPAEAAFEHATAGSQRTYRWSFKELPACEDEPASARWQERCGRLRFTTCQSPGAWTSALLEAVEAAAEPDDRIKAFAADAVGDELDATAKVRKIGDKLKATMNYVGDAEAWAGGRVRPAGEVLESSYQNAPEAAALCVAALRAAAIDASPGVAVYAPTWHDDVPVDTAAEAFMVSAKTGDDTVWLHPNEGIADGFGHWSRHTLLALDESGELRRFALADEQRDPLAQLYVRGKLTIGDDGTLTGRLHVRLTGRFVAAESLRTDEQKKSRIGSIAKSLVPGLKVADLSVSELSAGRFEAEANVELPDPLDSVGQLRTLTLSDDLPFQETVALPLDRPDRRTPVRLASPFDEDIELAIEFPEGWTAVATPAGLDRASENFAAWARIGQDVEASANRLRIHRQVRLATEEIAADDFARIRDAINTLRGQAYRRMAFQTKTD